MRSFGSRAMFGAVTCLLAACGDDGVRDGSGGGGGAGGGSTTSASASTGLLGVTASSASQVSSAYASATTGAGGDGGSGAAAVCAPVDSLPGAGGNCGEGGSTPDDCGTAENEGCAARTLCGDGVVYPIAAGDVLFGWVGNTVGSVADDLTFEPLLDDTYAFLMGTDPRGFAYVTASDGASYSDLVRLSHDGEAERLRPFGSPGIYYAEGDVSGNLVLWNPGFTQPLSADEPLEGEGETALHSLDDSGTQRWSRRYGVDVSGFGFEFRSFAVEPDGDIAVVGGYDGEVDFGPDALPVGAFGFIARIDGGTGDVEWVNVLPDPRFTPNTVLFAPDGTIVAAGSTFDDETFSQHGLIVRVASDGETEWTRELGGDALHSVYLFDATLVGDALVVVGGMSGTVELGDLIATSAGLSTEPLVLRIDLDGTPRWIRTFDVASTDELEVDAAADLYVAAPLCGRAYVAGSLDGPSIANLDGVPVENQLESSEPRVGFGLEIAIDP